MSLTCAGAPQCSTLQGCDKMRQIRSPVTLQIINPTALVLDLRSMTSDTRQHPSPSLLRHFTAMLYDAMLVIALVFVVNAIALGVVVQVSGGQREVVGPHLGQALIVFSVVGFFSAFWLKSGQTLGMQAWRIQLVRFDGEKPRLWQALMRCAGAAVSFACLGLGYLWKLFDRNDRYWHDYLSGTELVLLPKRDKE